MYVCSRARFVRVRESMISIDKTFTLLQSGRVTAEWLRLRKLNVYGDRLRIIHSDSDACLMHFLAWYYTSILVPFSREANYSIF